MLDVLIAGGGANGLTLALALCRQTNLKVGIVEAKAYQQQDLHPGFDARVIALAKASQQMLTGLGLTEINQLSQPIKTIHVSDQGHLGQCLLSHQDYQLDALGYVIELNQLGQLLQNKLKALDERNLQWFCPDKIVRVEQDKARNCVTLESGQVLETKLLVVAEGGASPTRALVNLSSSSHDYQQLGLIANISTDRAHKGIAYERFTEFGPLALLPMQSTQGVNQFSLVWSLPPQHKDDYLHANDAVFLAELQQAFGFRAGRFVAVGQRHCYPLTLIKSDDYVQHRCVLLGNSAQTLHPIAGQGLNLGLRDVYDLVISLLSATSQQLDVGSYAVLQQYRKAREQDKRMTIGLTHTLVKLFSNQHLPLVVGRNIGLFAMQLLSSAKAHFAHQSTGLKQLNRKSG